MRGCALTAGQPNERCATGQQMRGKNTIKYRANLQSPLSFGEGVLDVCMYEGDKERLSAS